MEDPKYPVYSFSASWQQDGEHDPAYPDAYMYKDQPPGRIRNGTGWSTMYKEEKTQEELDQIIQDWWAEYSTKNESLQNKGELIVYKLEGKLKEYAEWNLTWFAHETFDIGQTDIEVLGSFERYVSKIEEENWGKDEFDHTSGHRTLMGAEDRWRWRAGANAEGERCENTPAPCRCKYCKEQGKLIIVH